MYYSLCEVKRILLMCVVEKHQQFKCVEVRTIFGQDKSKDQLEVSSEEDFASAIPNTSTFYFSDGLQRPSRCEFSSSFVHLLAFFFLLDI